MPTYMTLAANAVPYGQVTLASRLQDSFCNGFGGSQILPCSKCDSAITWCHWHTIFPSLTLHNQSVDTVDHNLCDYNSYYYSYWSLSHDEQCSKCWNRLHCWMIIKWQVWENRKKIRLVPLPYEVQLKQRIENLLHRTQNLCVLVWQKCSVLPYHTMMK